VTSLTSLYDDALGTLDHWPAPDDPQERLRSAYVGHLHAHPDALLRSCLPAHLTASALVLDDTGDRVLLTLHRKGAFWGQLGGHCEPEDATLAGAALREATEESGIAGLRLLGAGPVELHRHTLSSAFGGCGEHLDVRYAVVAPPGAEPVASDESDDVAWFPAGALPPAAVGDLAALVVRARAALRAAQASGRPASVSVSSASSASSATSVSSATSESPSPAVADTPSR
jgi:8-oxo-dGTP pyrophosphatase MutT (NUDIX family)